MDALSGKHVVVTGASAGIGAELCRQLGARGAHVTLAARSADKLARVAAEVAGAGGQAQAVPTDVTERAAVLKLADAARARFGEIDVWVSNAGAGVRHSLLTASESDMLAQFRLNCLASLWGYQAVIPGWLERGAAGQVIDVSSLAGLSGYLHHGGYSAAKHGLSGLGKTMRQELAGRGITLTTIYPGPTVSDFSANVTARDDGRTESAAPSSAESAASTAGAGLGPHPEPGDHPAGQAALPASAGTNPAATLASSESYRHSHNPLVRAFAAKQSTAHLARVIIRAMETRPLRVCPHPAGNMLIWLLEHAERPVLSLLARGLR
jgi:short-subunit dehydrogenase